MFFSFDTIEFMNIRMKYIDNPSKSPFEKGDFEVTSIPSFCILNSTF